MPRVLGSVGLVMIATGVGERVTGVRRVAGRHRDLDAVTLLEAVHDPGQPQGHRLVGVHHPLRRDHPVLQHPGAVGRDVEDLGEQDQLSRRSAHLCVAGSGRAQAQGDFGDPTTSAGAASGSEVKDTMVPGASCGGLLTWFAFEP